LLDKGAKLEERDYGKNPLSERELRELVGDAPVADFLNPRNELYRAKKMKQNPPSKEEAIRLILKEPNLLKRPVVVKGKKRILGYDEAALESLL
jgi:arsenate reductase